MAVASTLNQYTNSKVLTASPAELTLMLYDGAIRFTNMAVSALDSGDIAKAHVNIIKAEKIIDYLRTTLDMSYPVSEEFEKVYVYIFDSLTEANVKKDADILNEIIGHLRSLRDTWKEVMRINKENEEAG